MTRDQKIAKAKKLRADRRQVVEIARELGVSPTTIIRWTDPERNKRMLEKSREWKRRNARIVRARDRDYRHGVRPWKGDVRVLDRPDQFAPNRRCEERGCTTVLTIWNPGPNCYRHTTARPDENDEHVDVLYELHELMQAA